MEEDARGRTPRICLVIFWLKSNRLTKTGSEAGEVPQSCFVLIMIVGSTFLFRKIQKLVKIISVALSSLKNLKGTLYKDVGAL